MALEFFEKQNYEEFFVAGDFVDVITTTGEKLVLATSSVVAVDREGTDVTNTVLETATKKLDTSPDSASGFTDNMLAIRCKAGVQASSPYKITFYGVTTEDNKWEIDINMKIKEK